MRAVIKEDCYGSSIYSYTNGIFFSKEDIVKVISKKHDFYEVEVRDGRRFYVKNSFLDIGDGSDSVTEPLITLANIANEKDTVHTSTSKIKSDGGSSDYYKVELKLPMPLYDHNDNLVGIITFETQDILYALVGGEWTLSNIVKACRRAWLSLQGGGKEGNDITYEAKKIHWFAGDFLKRFGKVSEPRKGVI